MESVRDMKTPPMTAESLGMEGDGALTPWRDLVAQQAALELEMTEAGRARYLDRRTAARSAGRGGETASGLAMIDRHTPALAEAIEAWLARAEASGRGRRPTAVGYLRRVTPIQAAYLTLRTLMNELGRRSPPLSAAALAVAGAIEDEVRFLDLRVMDLRAYDRLKELSRRRAGYRARRALFLRGAQALEQDWEDWPKVEKELLGAQLIGLAIEALGLVAITERAIGRKTVKYLEPTEAAEAWMNRIDRSASVARPLSEPMVIPPTPWTGADGGGWLTRAVRPLTLVKTRRRAYLDDLAGQEMPMVFTALNAAQATPWRINEPVLRAMEALAANPCEAALAAGLPPAPMPRPAPPEGLERMDPAARAAALEAHGKRGRAWRGAEEERRSKAAAFALTLHSARRFRRFRRIYFPMTLDFRGRLYAAPRFGPQGPDAMKGLLRFARGKRLGAEGWKWLAIHLCNSGDFLKMSKAPLDRRVDWVRRNQNRILTVAADPLADVWWTEADKPWQFLAACLEWAGFVEQGEDFVSHLPVALDGSCSGIQHFSLALRDPVGGAAVNLVPRDQPSDIYQEVADTVTALLRQDLTSNAGFRCGRASDGAARVVAVAPLAAQWLAFGVTRAVCKRPTMTYGYGARGYGYTDQILEDTLAPALEAHRRDGAPWPFSGAGFEAAVYLAARITEAVERVVLKAAEAMRWLQEAASVAAAEGAPLRWTLPDGFPVLQSYPDTIHRRVRTTIAGRSISLKIREDQPGVDARLQRQGVAPNFVHSLDACHLRLTVTRAAEEGLRDFALVHDSFGVHAADTPRFFRIIRETIIEMYGSVDVVESFREELLAQLSERGRARLAPAPGKGALALDAVIDCDYCFA